MRYGDDEAVRPFASLDGTAGVVSNVMSGEPADPTASGPVDAERCTKCGAPAFKVAENPVTNKLQCKMCGALQD
jgi:ribosomal protein L40E